MSQINVTPLVDVMLVLLVIFMVTAPILQQGVPVELPRVKVAPLGAQEPPLIVSVTRDGLVYLDDEVVLLAELVEDLGSMAEKQPDRPIFIRGDAEVAFGEVVAVMSALKSAGIGRVGVVTEPPTADETDS